LPPDPAAPGALLLTAYLPRDATVGNASQPLGSSIAPRRRLTVTPVTHHVDSREFLQLSATVTNGPFVDTAFTGTTLSVAPLDANCFVQPRRVDHSRFSGGKVAMNGFYFEPRSADTGRCTRFTVATRKNCTTVLAFSDFDSVRAVEGPMTSRVTSEGLVGWAGKPVLGAVGCGVSGGACLEVSSLIADYPRLPPPSANARYRAVTVEKTALPLTIALWMYATRPPVSADYVGRTASIVSTTDKCGSDTGFGFAVRYQGYTVVKPYGVEQFNHRAPTLHVELPGLGLVAVPRSPAASAAAPFNLTFDKWTHVALSVDRIRAAVYVDGELRLTVPATRWIGAAPSATILMGSRWPVAKACGMRLVQFRGRFDKIEIRRATFDASAQAARLLYRESTERYALRQVPCNERIADSPAQCDCNRVRARAIADSPFTGAAAARGNPFNATVTCDAFALPDSFRARQRRTVSCSEVCQQACRVTFSATTRNGAVVMNNVTTTFFVRPPVAQRFTSSRQDSGRMFTLTAHGRGLGQGDYVRLLWRSNNCTSTAHFTVRPVTLTLATPVFRDGANFNVSYTGMVESAGPHRVCYYMPHRPPVSLGILHFNAEVNVSTALEGPLIDAAQRSAVTIRGYGLNSFRDRLAFVLDTGYGSDRTGLAFNGGASSSVTSCAGLPPSVNSYSVPYVVSPYSTTMMSYGRRVRRNVTAPVAGCYAACYQPEYAATPTLISRRLCVRGVPLYYNIITSATAGTITVEIAGRGLDHTKPDDIWAVPTKFGARCNATLKKNPTIGYRFSPVSSSLSKLTVRGAVMEATTYWLCFRSWVWGPSTAVQGRPFQLAQRVQPRSVVVPRYQVTAGENFQISVNGSGLHPDRDRMALIEDTNCNRLNANTVGSTPVGYMQALLRSYQYDRADRTFVTMQGSLETAGDYSVCYELHTRRGVWLHLFGKQAGGGNTTLRIWSRVDYTRYRGVNEPNRVVAAGRYFTVVIRGRGLDITRDRVFMQRRMPGIEGCGDSRLDIRFRQFATVVPKIPNRGMRENRWNISLQAQGQYVVCYIAYQRPTISVQADRNLNVTGLPSKFRLFTATDMKPRVGEAFNFTVLGGGLSTQRDQVRLVKGPLFSCNPTDLFLSEVAIGTTVNGVEIFNPATAVGTPLYPVYQLELYRRPSATRPRELLSTIPIRQGMSARGTVTCATDPTKAMLLVHTVRQQRASSRAHASLRGISLRSPNTAAASMNSKFRALSIPTRYRSVGIRRLVSERSTRTAPRRPVGFSTLPRRPSAPSARFLSTVKRRPSVTV
jgi:hypothetical protein